MKQTSERKMQLALGKLLTEVSHTNKWSEETFTTLASKAHVARTEAIRFYHSLIDMNLLKFDNLRQTYVANFNVSIWTDEDAKLGLIRELMEMFQIRLPKGPAKGSKKSAKKAEPKAQNMEEAAILLEAEINPLSQFSAADLVAELRSRGYEVKASKVITTVEEL
jgi:hypothetical protein